MDKAEKIITRITEWAKQPWTVEDEAIHRGMNYAEYWEQDIKELMQEGLSLHGVLKQAYQQGFLHGFEHKFDNTNYEEKKDD